MTLKLRFLADESCDFIVVRALRAGGYDVFAVSEVTSRSDDLRPFLRRLARSGQLAAVSLSTWAPDLAGAAQSQSTVLDLLAELT